MKEIFLHIGMHKTGSTSIQHSLQNFDDGKTRYARFKEKNHSIPMFTMFSETRYSYPIWKNRGYTPEYIDTIRSEYFSVLQAELDDNARKRLIISGEDISIISDAGKADLLHYLNSRNMDVKIVCFLRNPKDFAASSLQQLIRGGLRFPQPIIPKYFLRLKFFSNHCLPERLIVKDFDETVTEQGGIIGAFAKTCLIDSAHLKPIAANQAISSSATKLIYLLNRSKETTFGTIERFDARQKVIEIISKSFPVTSAISKIDKNIVAGLITLQDGELDYIRNKFCIDYEATEGGNISDVHSYLSDISDVDVGKIKKILEQLRIEHNYGDDLEGMMVSMYRGVLGRLS